MKAAFVVFLTLWCHTLSSAQPICDFLGKDSLAVAFAGDTIKVWDMAVCGTCASQFSVYITRSNDSLFIWQTDISGIRATCDCLFNICAIVVGIPAGTYTAVIYRDWHLIFHNLPQPILIKSMKFVYNPQGSPIYSINEIQSNCLLTSVQEKPLVIPIQFELLPNYPNPFNPSTSIWFKTSKTEFVQIKVFDSLGKEIQTLVSEVKLPGLHRVEFNAAPELSSGVYYYQMQTDSYNQTRSMVLLR